MKPGTSVTLYQVADIYLKALHELAERDDLPPEVVEGTLALHGQLAVKAANVAAFVANCEVEAAALAARAKELSDRAKRAQKVADGLRAYLASQLLRAGVKEAKHEDTRVLLVKNPPAVKIEDELLLPEKFLRTPPPPPPPPAEPDKKAIGDALKAGEVVPGAVLLQSYRVKID